MGDGQLRLVEQLAIELRRVRGREVGRRRGERAVVRESRSQLTVAVQSSRCRVHSFSYSFSFSYSPLVRSLQEEVAP
jgi:hypothetical protein